MSGTPKQDAHELFRRMVFNAMISNSDDHPRNHAVVAQAQAWELSPAYDLVPTTPVSVEHRDLALICGDAGRFANRTNLLSQCARFLLNRDDARAIFDTMHTQVESRWHAVARAAGVSEADCRRIAHAFLYEGLFYGDV